MQLDLVQNRTRMIISKPLLCLEHRKNKTISLQLNTCQISKATINKHGQDSKIKGITFNPNNMGFYITTYKLGMIASQIISNNYNGMNNSQLINLKNSYQIESFK
jgi:hypothetical protein